jgi:hypothetical protein
MATNVVTLDSNSIKALASALKGSGGGGFGGGGSGTGSTGSFDKSMISNAASAVSSGLKTGLESLKTTVTNNMEVWRGLSKVGANFSNDVIRMSTAAAEARVSLEEFAGIIDKSAKDFAGLGGSVTRGVEAFAKLTKNFQDNDISRRMQQLGYTSNEANELLALQVGFMRTKFGLDKTSQDTQFQAVSELANEMDLLSKITGQSREEQAKLLQQEKDNAAIEAKFKLIGITKGEKAEAEARQKYGIEFAKAAARGQGEVFRDAFLMDGGVRSKDAAMQRAVGGKAAEDTARAAAALAKGNSDLAAEYNKSADANMVALQKNTAALQLTVLAGSEIGGKVADTFGNLATKNRALVDSVDAIEKANLALGEEQKSYAQLIKQIREDVRRSQEGERKNTDPKTGLPTGEYQQVSSATRAIIDSKKLQDDVVAAVKGGAEQIFKPAIDRLGSEVSELTKQIQNQDVNRNIRSDVEEGIRKGLESQGKEGGAFGKIAFETQKMGNTISTGLSGVVNGATDIVNTLREGPVPVKASEPLPIKIDTAKAASGPVGPMPGQQIESPKRNKGSLETTGKLFENWGSGTLVELHGMESVMRPEDLEKLVMKTVGGIGQGMKDFKQSATGSINLNEISKTISTSVSAATSSISKPVTQAAPQEVQTKTGKDIAAQRSIEFGSIGLDDNQKKIYNEMISLSENAAKSKLADIKAEKEAAEKINSITGKQMREMEERYEKEGKLAELESNEEYKRLNEQLNASNKLSKEKKKELDAAMQGAETRATLAKTNEYQINDAKKLQISAADEVIKAQEKTSDAVIKAQEKTSDEVIKAQDQTSREIAKNSELTKTSIVGALPVSEIKKTSEELTFGLNESQKNYFNVIKEQDQESLKLKENGLKNQIEADINGLRETDKKIAEVKSSLGNATTEHEKKQLGFKLMALEKERSAYEESMQFTEENLEVVERAIEAKKLESDATKQVVAATDEKIEKVSADVKATQDLISATSDAETAKKNEATATEQVVAATDSQIQADKDLDAAIAEMNANQKNAVAGKPENNSQTIENTERQRRAAAQARPKQEQPKSDTKKVPSINEMVQELAKASGVKDVNKIQTGQKIKLPDGSDYVVKQGDTLSKIAQQTIKDMKSKVAAPDDKTTNKTQQATQDAGKVSDSQTIENTERQRRAAAQARSKDAEKPKQETPKTESISSQQKATLDDVVKSLDMLNKMMGQLISVNESLGKQQIKALKSNSTNIYERF